MHCRIRSWRNCAYPGSLVPEIPGTANARPRGNVCTAGARHGMEVCWESKLEP